MPVKFYDVEQNTEEWFDLRCAHLTGSAIAKIMANLSKSFGEPAKKLAVQLAIESVTGKYISSSYSNAHMERGHEEEPVARRLYEELTFNTVSNGGFFTSGFTGCSPDGLVGSKGVVEIKSVIGTTQYERWRTNKYDSTYKWQLLHNLRETGRDWIDYVSYSSEYPKKGQLYIERLEASNYLDEYEMMKVRIKEFKKLVTEIKKTMK